MALNLISVFHDDVAGFVLKCTAFKQGIYTRENHKLASCKISCKIGNCKIVTSTLFYV